MKPQKRQNGINDEWYTPQKYVEAAEKVMGWIDLDPASNVVAASWIPAGSYYTKEDDALRRCWEGNIWLNPPYSRPLLKLFIEKLINELESNTVQQAVVLTHSNTDTAWWHVLARKADAICFTRGRIKFISPNRDKKSGFTHGQTFFYFGDNVRRFEEIFEEFGFVVKIS